MADEWLESVCNVVFNQYSSPGCDRLTYGTAGFRTSIFHMNYLCTRIALLSAVRAINQGATIGVMLTASHNPWTDNGVKLIDPDGSMLESSWETIADRFVNCDDISESTAILKELLPYELQKEFDHHLLNDVDSRNVSPMGIMSKIHRLGLSKLIHKNEITSHEDLSRTLCTLAPSRRHLARVLVAYDTRQHNSRLAKFIRSGCDAMHVSCEIFGFLTTPQLHYIVRAANNDIFGSYGEPSEQGYYKKFSTAFTNIFRIADQLMVHFGSPRSHVRVYPYDVYIDVSNGIGGPKIRRLLEEVRRRSCLRNRVEILNNRAQCVVDSPYDEDIPALDSELQEREQADRDAFTARMRNEERKTEANQSLNMNCGADYVKTNLCFPASFDQSLTMPSHLTGSHLDSDEYIPVNYRLRYRHCAALDGDADRIVYFHQMFDESGKLVFSLLDGDRIAVLYAMFLASVIDQVKSLKVKMGVVQTAYSNGRCRRYIEDNLKLPVVVAQTGVKNLHKEAKAFDIGIYFEANGHGTVLFQDWVIDFLEKAAHVVKPPGSQSKRKARKVSGKRQAAVDPSLNFSMCSLLLEFINLTNQTTGDAMTNFLSIEFILEYMRMSLEDWSSFYEDMPNTILKYNPYSGNVTIALNSSEMELIESDDATESASHSEASTQPEKLQSEQTDAGPRSLRDYIEVEGPDCKCIKPASLQRHIDSFISKYAKDDARAFVRPSGTEPIISVYVEAIEMSVVKKISQRMIELLNRYVTVSGFGRPSSSVPSPKCPASDKVNIHASHYQPVPAIAQPTQNQFLNIQHLPQNVVWPSYGMPILCYPMNADSAIGGGQISGPVFVAPHLAGTFATGPAQFISATGIQTLPSAHMISVPSHHDQPQQQQQQQQQQSHVVRRFSIPNRLMGESQSNIQNYSSHHYQQNPTQQTQHYPPSSQIHRYQRMPHSKMPPVQKNQIQYQVRRNCLQRKPRFQPPQIEYGQDMIMGGINKLSEIQPSGYNNPATQQLGFPVQVVQSSSSRQRADQVLHSRSGFSRRGRQSGHSGQRGYTYGTDRGSYSSMSPPLGFGDPAKIDLCGLVKTHELCDKRSSLQNLHIDHQEMTDPSCAVQKYDDLAINQNLAGQITSTAYGADNVDVKRIDMSQLNATASSMDTRRRAQRDGNPMEPNFNVAANYNPQAYATGGQSLIAATRQDCRMINPRLVFPVVLANPKATMVYSQPRCNNAQYPVQSNQLVNPAAISISDIQNPLICPIALEASIPTRPLNMPSYHSDNQTRCNQPHQQQQQPARSQQPAQSRRRHDVGFDRKP